MKKIIMLCMVAGLSATAAQAQEYKTSMGLATDIGEGTAYAGPAVKHFFNAKTAGQFEMVFGDNTTMVTAFYQHHGDLANSGGLKYYLGLGSSLGFPKVGKTFVGLRPTAGLDYNIKNAPLAVNFDWRPSFWIVSGDSDFAGGRFGLGLRLVLGKL